VVFVIVVHPAGIVGFVVLSLQAQTMIKSPTWCAGIVTDAASAVIGVEGRVIISDI
jgi:hypothetical protein